MAGRGHTIGLHKLTWAEGLTLARAVQKLGSDTMSEIDRQRVRGVEVLREMGFTWRNGRWLPLVSAENSRPLRGQLMPSIAC